MTDQIPNNDSWIGRVLIVFAFFFLLSYSNDDSSSKADSNSYSIEQGISSNSSATLVEAIDFTDYDNSLASCEFSQLKVSDSESGLSISDKVFNQQFKHQKQKFYTIKPKLLELQLIQSNSTQQEFPPIS